jgi:hypothetical protein
MTNKRQPSGPRTILACSGLLIALFLIQPAAAKAQWTTPDANQNINNTNTGNVGIGTTTPAALLEVKKSQSAATNIIVDNPFTSAGNSAYSAFTLKQAGVNRLHIASVNDNHSFLTPGTAQFWNFANAPTVFATNNTEQMRISASGLVGIGTSSPEVKLTVHHSSANTNLGSLTLPDLALGLRNTSNTNGSISIISFQDASGYGNVNIGAIQKDQTNHAADLVFLTRNGPTAFGERMRVRSDGNVGIGTNAPAYKLDVAGEIRSTGGFRFPDGSIQMTAAGSGGGGGTITSVVAGTGLSGGGSSGAVTLTNADPGSAQSIFKNVANSAGATQFSAGSNNDSIRFQGNGGTTVSFDAATKKVIIDGSTSTLSAANISAGQFGQNTGGGNYTFAGNVTVNGNIAAKYQDVAEWVDSSQALTPGTVVVLDSDRSNQVIAATQSYDSHVAGVISLQPGLALGEQGEGRVLVATTGRVKVKVDATNGPIQIGDLLVTSDREGFAMKSLAIEIGGARIHRPGTLIGKALEPLAKGTGEILVLLSLQ